MALPSTFPRPVEPLTQRNQFRERKYTPAEIMPFSKARNLLPIPILPTRPGWVEMYWRAWELSWNHLWRPSSRSGFIAHYISSASSEHMLMWSSAFMVQFGLYARRAADFMGTLDNLYSKQHPDGFICREIRVEDGRDYFYPFDPNSTGPNILAWAEWNYYRHTGDDSRLATVFWPLMAYHRWLRAHRTWPSKLYWTTGTAGGMANQGRVPGGEHHHQHWAWVDVNMQAILDCLILSRIAQMEQETDLAQELVDERAFLLREVNERLWSEDARFYLDISPQGDFSSVKSIAAYWSLLDKDMVPPDRLAPFVQHLRDPESFNRPHRIPSQAADSPNYDAETGAYWRGGVWAPMNYMVLKGLRAHGQHRLAHQIAMNHLQNVFEVFQRTDTFWENYSPETVAPGIPAERNFVGWTGLSPISILLEEVIGLQVDWPQRRITWDRRLQDRAPDGAPYGIRNFPLGMSGILDLVGDGEKIEIRTDHPFTLTVLDDEGQLQTAVAAGASEIVR